MTFFRGLGVIFGVVFLVASLGLWWALTSTNLDNWRRETVERALNAGLEVPIEISGDLRLHGLPELNLTVTQVLVGNSDDDVRLAELPSVTLTIDVPKLLTGELDFSKIRAEGLLVNFVTERDGRKTWTMQGQGAVPYVDRLIDHSVIEYLISRDAEFANFYLNVENKISGFTFAGSVSAFSVDEDETTGRSAATGHGTINGLPFELVGAYDRETGSTEVTVGSISAKFDGQLLQQGEQGYEGDLSVSVGELGDLFHVLKLDSPIQGHGSLEAKLRRSAGEFQLTNLHAQAETAAGSKGVLTGSIEDLIDLTGLNLQLDTKHSNVSLGQLPLLEADDLSLQSVSAIITGSADAVALSDVNLKVNSKSRGVETFGPLSVGNITRQDDNTLHLSALDWTFSDADGTNVGFHGEVHDLLSFEDYRLEGRGVVALAQLVETIVPEGLPDIGLGQFSAVLSDAGGALGVEEFEVSLEETQSWDLNVSGTASNLNKLDQFNLELFVRSDGQTSLAEALKLPDHLLGPYELAAKMEEHDHGIEVALNATIGRSDFFADVIANHKTLVPELRGRVQSDKLDITQLGELMGWIKGEFLQQVDTERSEVRPLKVPPGPESLRIPGRPAVQPLVIDTVPSVEDTTASRWIGKSDIRLQASVAQLVGLPGVRTFESDIVVDRGVMSVGPIRFDENGQSALVNAEIDLLQSPNTARLHGKVLGWTLQGLTSLLGWDVAAQGSLSTSFDLTGNIQSLESFLRSSSGHVALRLKDGRIGSSLLKLAGHGVLPWLFSDELSRGASNVSCMVVPIRLNSGVATIESAVLETDTTQLVVTGQVNLRSGQIQARGEPRPLGRPFEPSPYPFQVTGTYSEPDFVLLNQLPRVGTKRLRVVNRHPCQPDRQQVQGR